MTDNPYRDLMVQKAIAQNPAEPLTVDAIAKHLPPDFDLGDDDLQPYREAATAKAESADVEFESAPETRPVVMGRKFLDPEAAARAYAARAGAAEPEAAPAAPDPDAIEAAVKRRNAADQALANRRVELLAAQSAERDARAALATAVTTFQRGFPPLTPEQLRRQHVQEQAEIRAAIKDGRLAPRKGHGHGKSVVDAMAFYGRGGNPARGDYRRGAFPSQSYGTLNRDPRRGPVGKLPSEL